MKLVTTQGGGGYFNYDNEQAWVNHGRNSAAKCGMSRDCEADVPVVTSVVE